MLRARFIAWGLWCAAGLSACERAAVKPPPQTQPQEAHYEVRGILKRADAAGGHAVIAHEEIPGYMDAMTMEFTASRPGELKGFLPGDVLAFRLNVSEGGSSISQIRKVGQGSVPQDSPVAGLPAPGEPLVGFSLIGDQGQAVKSGDYQGRVLAITFVFTRCPLPDYCPLLNRNFSVVQRELSSAGAGWHLLSVSIDPEFDTPERLAAYAKGHRGDAGNWTFATGDKGEIAKLAAQFGLATKGTGQALEHNLRTAVVGADGRVRKVFTGNAWKPEELTAEMKRAMGER